MSKVTISGPGCDETREGVGPGLSLATTHANRAAMRREEVTFYVRDLDGNTLGTAESTDRGGVIVHGHGNLA